MSKQLELALGYAARGWRVFPVFPPTKDGECPCRIEGCLKAGKHPAISKWQEKATTDETQIRSWWTSWPDYNIAIATGSESNLLVLDADGPQGQLEASSRGMPENTPAVQTGRVDGGTHYYFQCPDDFDARNFAGAVQGLDARANGGYVIAAGSKHASGAVYKWAEPPTDPLPEPPDWLIELLKESAPTADNKRLIQGQRNDTLFSMARSMRRNGQSEQSVLSSIKMANKEVCRPPLPDSEIEALVASACKAEYDTGPDLTARLEDSDLGAVEVTGKYLRELPMTEAGNAECFTELYANQFRFVPEWKMWLRWNGSIWAEDKSQAYKRAMLITVRARALAAPMLPDKEERRALMAFSRSQESNNRIEGALKLAQVLPGVTSAPELFDTDPWLLGMNGHTWNFRDARRRPPDKADLITRSVGAEWDPNATAPIWEKTLREVFQNDDALIAYFQRAVGYSLTGSNSEQVMFLCVGSGANGKSTILGAMRDMAGNYAASARFETFDADVKSTTGDDLAVLRGKRLVLVIEADQQRKLAEGRIKQVTGGTDLITCRHLYGKDFSYRPEFKIWMAVNHKPTIRGQDEGIWRRIHLIPFNARFEGNARDPLLDEKLRSELPGILNWALRGALEWQKRGLNPPEAVVAATKEYRKESDIVGMWIDDCVVEDPTKETTKADLYLSYRNWAGDNGLRAMSANMLGRILAERGFTRGMNKKRKTTYKGIAVNEQSWLGAEEL